MLVARSITRLAGAKPLLDRLDLEIRAGERVSLAGPSGAGKTVLLRALGLLDPLDGGELLFRGTPIEPAGVPRFRCRVGYLHQAPALVEGTVEDNLRLPFALEAHRQQRYDRTGALGLLRHLGKDEPFLDRRRGELSGGEAQIAALVRLLQLSPSLLLLDEPTAALDPESARLAADLLQEWQQAAAERAYLWVTHDASLAESIAGRHLGLAGGRLAQSRRSTLP